MGLALRLPRRPADAAEPRSRSRQGRRPMDPAAIARIFAVTLFATALLAAFLSPLVRAATIAFKTPEQIAQVDSPIWPADPRTFTYRDTTYDVYLVPLPDGTKELALVEKGRAESKFLDPANPGAGLVTWQGSWRTLQRTWTFAPQLSNFADVWNLIDYPRLLFNTIALAVIGLVGVLVSCTLVAYGFARFRIPGKGVLFTILIATIFLPAAVTIIPTYTMFVKIGWVGSWLPLLVPAFFANAYDVFLLRQYLLTIPREMDEAAAIEGAGPFRTLISVIIPQAWPVIGAVAIFHLVYAWNDFFAPLIYLSTREDLQPLAVGLARFNGVHYRNPALIQAGTLMTLVIPVVLFLLFQRVFTRGIVITGVEK